MYKSGKDNIIRVNFAKQYSEELKELICSNDLTSEEIINKDLVRKVFILMKKDTSLNAKHLAILLYTKETKNWDIFDRFIIEVFPSIIKQLSQIFEDELVTTDRKEWSPEIKKEYLSNPEFRKVIDSRIKEKNDRASKLHEKYYEKKPLRNLILIDNKEEK